VQATDSGGSQPVTQALSITVNAESPLSVASTSLPVPAVGQSYVHVLGQKGGDGPYTWAVTGGALPSGITLSSVGILQGVPSVAGTFNFTVRVTDSSTPAQSATANLTLYIGPAASVVLPAAGATVQGTTVFDAMASSQNGIASVQFEISGGSISDKVIGTGIATIYGYLSNVNTATIPNGTYAVQAVATDNQGLHATSAPVSVTFTNPPTTSVLVPSKGATVSGTTYLDASATNATSVQFLLYGGSYGFAPPTVCTATLTLYGWLCDWDSTTVPDSSYTLVSEAIGPAGTTYSSGIGFTVKN
jgi:hypothetical protein